MNGTTPDNRKARRAARKGGQGRGGQPAQADVDALIGLYRAGRLDEAVAAAGRFTRRWPRVAVGWNVLAASHQAAGRPAEAAEAYRRAVRLEPGNPDAHNNHGLVLWLLGRSGEAEAAYRRALEARPAFPEARFNLGLVLADLGRDDEAEACFQAVLEDRPGFADAANALGNLYRGRGRLADAEAAYRRALAQRPGYAEVESNLGEVLRAQGRVDEAIAAFGRALKRRPGYAEAHSNLGLALADAGRPRDAAAAYRRALEFAPQRVEIGVNLGRALRDQGRLDEAERAYRDVLDARPESADAWTGLGNLLADRGRLDEAIRAYRRALELEPDNARLHYHLAAVKRFTPGDPDLETLERHLGAASERPAADGAYLHYAAAKAHADAGADPDRVFGHYAAGARLWRSTLDYDVAADEALFAAIAATFDGTGAASPAGPGEAAAPIFIVGMPRSGTTLVEQMLASHPRVHGAGERPDLDRIVAAESRARGRSFPGWVAGLAPDEVAALRRRYGEAVIDPVTGADRITDKMPANFRYLGLVATMLPEARVVHVRRSPADTCVSCFTYLFAGRQAFSYDLAELGRYYRAYDALMAHWRAVLPDGFMLEVHYEDLVGEPERELRRLLAHCGLDWDAGCLDFHRSERAVETASAAQVRQPLYRDAIGRWRAYRAHLGPLLEALGPLAPDEWA